MRPSLLRDTSRLTRLLILGEVRVRRPSKLKGIAEALDVSVQAVSTYMRDLQKAELVEREEGTYVLTRDGMQTLLEGYRDLKSAVDEAVSRFELVESTAAVAAEALEAGDEVGLVMREGVLTAVPGVDAGSRGIAGMDVEAGEDVAVHDLQGVVDLEPGTLWVLRVPPVDRGGSRAVDPQAVHRVLDARGVDPDRVAVLGVEARVLARKVDLDPTIEFAPMEAAYHAATLGLDVLMLVSNDRLKDALSELDTLEESALEHVPVHILEPGEPTP